MRKLAVGELNRASLESFKQQSKTPLALVLDNVRSALNVGSAFRTADGFALEKIYLCGITACPPNRDILKTALGATESVDWAYMKDPVDAIRQLQAAGWKVLVVEQTSESHMLQDFVPDQNEKIALVFGNEVYGVSDSVVVMADGALEVPQFGTKHSLNVAVCIGIVVWDLFNKLRFRENNGKHSGKPEN